MKSIIPGILAFIICIIIYNSFCGYISMERRAGYETGYHHGWMKKVKLETDSIDTAIQEIQKKRDSLFNAIENESTIN